MIMKLTTTKALTLILATALAFMSASAEARGFFGPRIGVGLGFGYPYYGWYDPWVYSPFYAYPYPYAYRVPVPEERTPDKLYAYPEKGQSSEQTAQDRNECKAWAVEQSGLDPATAKRREKNQRMDDYNRAFMACMEGRDYTVK
jgi:hypothetical protein